MNGLMSTVTLKRFILFFFAVFMLSGCITPAGQLTHEDFGWKTVKTKYDFQESFRRMNTGFRKCGQFVAEGNVYNDNKTAQIDLYFKAAFGGRSDWVAGRVDIAADGTGSVVNLGLIQRMSAIKEDHPFLLSWATYLNDTYECN
ncbi:MAG: hypothetical protein A2X58_08565 [Nitrospirae bacterium GWC2_56_14]|nr:MAG: hypothetical protein A2X58_08565 [Nitrospirae bacterium GWC2_56_14]